MSQSPEQMSVDHGDDPFHHLHAHHTSGHLGDGSERHVIDEQDVQVRFSRFLTLLFHLRQFVVDEPCDRAFRIVHLADGVVHGQVPAPLATGDGMSQEFLKLFVLHLADQPGINPKG